LHDFLGGFPHLLGVSRGSIHQSSAWSLECRHRCSYGCGFDESVSSCGRLRKSVASR
jgi:hypothetical protein